QPGALRTAGLIAGDADLYAPPAPAIPVHPAQAREIPHVSIWPGGSAGYVKAEHPAPNVLQLDQRWDWLRNRLVFVPESPFQFASRMCIMTEPFGPAVSDRPAEYRSYAK